MYTYADSIYCNSYLGSLSFVIPPDFEGSPKSDNWALRTHLATKIGNQSRFTDHSATTKCLSLLPGCDISLPILRPFYTPLIGTTDHRPVQKSILVVPTMSVPEPRRSFKPCHRTRSISRQLFETVIIWVSVTNPQEARLGFLNRLRPIVAWLDSL